LFSLLFDVELQIQYVKITLSPVQFWNYLLHLSVYKLKIYLEAVALDTVGVRLWKIQTFPDGKAETCILKRVKTFCGSEL
jgi:hypothetical protein